MRKCKVCKQEIIGRSDKIFCSVNCKNKYHRHLRKLTNVAVQDINKILHRNRSILYEIMGPKAKSKTVDRLLLDQKKFSFLYHTHLQVNSKGKTYYYVYDFAWMSFSDDKILITRRKYV